MPEIVAGRYRLDRELGRSRMSEVWLAHDLELDRPVALKLLAPSADTGRFEREARAVAALGDPNVTQLYDFGEAGGRPFIVFEYLRGGTLEQRLGEQGRLADDEALRIATDVAAGLAHAHSRGIVHRDLKPANILFDDEDRAKLGDFGIARLDAGSGTLTDPGTLLGTAAYISPEQAAGLPAGAASDVYSLGVILYRMLAGRLPFESDDPLELVRLHRDADPPPLARVRTDAPPELVLAVDAMLTRDPARRPPDGGAALDLLRPHVGSVGPAGPAAATTRILPPPRSRRRGATLGVVLAALAAAGGTVAWELTKPADGTVPATSRAASRPLTTHASTTRQVTTQPAILPTTTAATSSTTPTTTRRATTSTERATTSTERATTTQPATTSAQAATTVQTEPPTTTTTTPTTTAEPATTTTTATTTGP